MLAFLNLAVSMGGISQFLLGNQDESLLCVKGGAKTICDQLVRQVGIENVMLNQTVTGITTTTDEKVLITTKSQQTFMASFVICTIPLNLVSNNRIEFHPPLDAKLRFTLQNFVPAEMSKFFLIYEHKFWKKDEQKCLKDYFLLIDLRNAQNLESSSPFVYVMECGIESVEQGVLMGFLNDFESIEWSVEEEEHLRIKIINSLTNFTGNQKFRDFQYFIVKHWSEESFWGSVFPTIGSMRYNEMLRDVHGKIVLAGAETSCSCIGQIPGAIQSGQRAAIQTLAQIRPQTLTVHDYDKLKSTCLSPQERVMLLRNKKKERETEYWLGDTNNGKLWSFCRWTIFLPLAGLTIAFLALPFREKYAKLL